MWIVTRVDLRGYSILSWIDHTGIGSAKIRSDESDEPGWFAHLKHAEDFNWAAALKVDGRHTFSVKMPTGGTQNIALTHRAVLEDKNPGSIGREVRRRKDGTIGKVLAAGKRNGGRKANKYEKTVGEREFPYPTVG